MGNKEKFLRLLEREHEFPDLEKTTAWYELGCFLDETEDGTRTVRDVLNKLIRAGEVVREKGHKVPSDLRIISRRTMAEVGRHSGGLWFYSKV